MRPNLGRRCRCRRWPATAAPLYLWLAAAAAAINLCRAELMANVLDAPEFVVQARLRLIRQDSKTVDGEAEISEYYSSRHLRARVEVSVLSHDYKATSSRADYVTYYYSAAPDNQQLVRETDEACAKVERKQFYMDLFSLYDDTDFSSIRDSWLNVGPLQVNPHVIGVARFLSDLQQDLGAAVRDPNEKNIRNRKAIKYTYTLKKPSSRVEDVLHVYYQLNNNSSSQQEPDLKRDIPIRLKFELSDGTEIQIDYMVVAQFHDLEYLNNEGLSRFSFPLVASCLKELPATDLTANLDIQSMSFLFQRVISRRLSSLRRWEFVAFDKLAKALRIDTIQEKRIAPGRGMFMLSIVDLKLRRRFFIKQFRYRNWPEAQRCIAAPYQPELVANLPLPLDKLIRLGPARVRGIETMAYLSTILPEVLYPSDQFESPEGNLINQAEKLINCGDQECLVIYYFSRSGSQAGMEVGQLLRIDVADEEGLVERLEVHQFAFELLDAPNGDSRNSLFSVRDRCRGNLTTLPVELAVDLEMKPGASELVEHEDGSTLEYLVKPSKLSLGLQRALISSTWINAANLYDFRAQPTFRQGNFLVQVRAKLANLDEVPTFKAKFSGWAPVGRAKRASRALDWSECFATSATRNLYREGAMPTFSYCQHSCLLDWEKRDIVASPNSSDSSDEHCRVYQVAQVDRSSLVQDGGYWNNLAASIQDTHQTVKLLDCPGCAPSVSFDVRRAFIESDDFEDPEQRELRELSKALAGVGLSPEESRQVEPPQLAQVDKDTLELGQPEMSLKVCQFSCMSNLACKSYSLCSLPDRLQCLISSADVRDKGFLELLTKARLNRTETASGVIDIPWTWKDKLSERASESEPSSASLFFRLALRLDKRCQTYTKRALDVFTKTETGHLMSAHSTGIDVLAANSRERCAKRCLERDLEFFKQVSVVTARLEENKKNAALDQLDQLETTKRQLDALMRSWCGHFAYLSKKQLSETMLEYLQAHTATNKTGYCLLSSVNEKRDLNSEALSSMPLEIGEVRVQEFLYGNLFERFPGVTLDTSSSLAGGKSLSDEPKASDNLRATMHLKNWQKSEYKEREEQCAKACFLQTVGLKPWCRSFSVLRPQRASKYVMCIYNSMTLADVLALGAEGAHLLRKLTPEEATHYVHFDQRREFLFDDYALARAQVSTGLMQFVTGEQVVSGHFLGVALVLMLALVSGVLLAAKLSFFLQNRIAATRQSDLIQMELPVDDED